MKGNFLKSRWFLMGIAIGFATCCLLGRQAGRRNFYEHFLRFNPYISAWGKYYPTMAQMRQIVLAECPRDKILVIIGGNSVFYGAGQPDELVWTKSLQQKLGDRYHVVNFALQASLPPGPAILVAESLSGTYPKVIFVFDSVGFALRQLSLDPNYRRMFWEAHDNGFVKMTPERLENATHLPNIYPELEEMRGEIFEARDGAALDSWLHFQDLWDLVSYRHVSTVWSNVFPDQWLGFMRPKRDGTDPTGMPQSLAARRVKWANDQVQRQNWQNVLDSARREVALDPSGKWVEINEQSWKMFDKIISLCVPVDIRSRTLVVFTPMNPGFYDENGRQALIALDDFTSRHYEAAGISTAMRDSIFTDEDYQDSVHLVPSGGEKIAAMTAAKIKEMAAGLGYLDTAK